MYSIADNMSADECNKWGEKYTRSRSDREGREVFESTIESGRSLINTGLILEVGIILPNVVTKSVLKFSVTAHSSGCMSICLTASLISVKDSLLYMRSFETHLN